MLGVEGYRNVEELIVPHIQHFQAGTCPIVIIIAGRIIKRKASHSRDTAGGRCVRQLSHRMSSRNPSSVHTQAGSCNNTGNTARCATRDDITSFNIIPDRFSEGHPGRVLHMPGENSGTSPVGLPRISGSSSFIVR